MLSYQHSYHAGNLADIHKHAALAWILSYLLKKPKPLTYLESHAGRGLYDLTSRESAKTGEAEAGITLALKTEWFDPAHPYLRALQDCRALHGPHAYPGSPLIAASLLRKEDHLHLAELHPQEHAALRDNLAQYKAKLYLQNGLDLLQALCPPTPRRGLVLMDPSYELKQDYAEIPKALTKVTRKWNVGSVMLWYPVLRSAAHTEMLAQLEAIYPEGLRHEVVFPPAKENHRMVGSGLFFINPPYGLMDELDRLSFCFKKGQTQ